MFYVHSWFFKLFFTCRFFKNCSLRQFKPGFSSKAPLVWFLMLFFGFSVEHFLLYIAFYSVNKIISRSPSYSRLLPFTRLYIHLPLILNSFLINMCPGVNCSQKTDFNIEVNETKGEIVAQRWLLGVGSLTFNALNYVQNSFYIFSTNGHYRWA